jgi:choline dehydrogenase-like flavoprotein
MTQAFDYVIVGGGSAGCVLAGRLSEDPAVSVCLLEAGGTGDSLLVNMPAGYAAMVPTKINNWAYETVPQAGLGGRRGYQPRGKALGGSSAINAMLYVRGHRWDYDHWAALGSPDWSYDRVLPYFCKAEHNEDFTGPLHGQGGPVNVMRVREPSPLNARFLEAAQAAGWPLIDDYNVAEPFGAYLFQVNQRNGERCSAAKAYLEPNRQRQNLHVMTGVLAEQICFDGKRATGVQVRVDGQSLTLQARCEVLLCAGAFGSPQLLALSGIGPAAHLQSLGISVRHDLPGVGENLQDHIDYVHACRSPGNQDTFGVSVSGGWRAARGLWQWQRGRQGALTTPFAESGAFIRSTADVLVPDLQLVFIMAIEDDHARKLRLGHGFTGRVALLRPKSSGTVRLASPDPRAAPLIDPRFFSDPDDMRIMKRGVRHLVSVIHGRALDDVRGKPLHPVDIDDDAALERSIRDHADTQYHPVGTCKMGIDPLAVVDQRLRVHGMTGLRVVDASIMPAVTSGNANAPTLMIGEKGADMIRADART